MSDLLPPKPQLLKEWHERKGNEPWTLEEIAELIADASWLSEQATEERIIKLLEEHAEQEFADNYARDDGTYHEDVCNLCAKWNGLGVAIALIKGEQE